MGLEKFTKSGKIETNEQKTALVFDMHNLIFRTVFIAHASDPTDLTFRAWKILILQSINAAIRKFTPDRVIFVIDAESSWRKEHYAEYKENRAELRKASPINFEAFFPVMNKFIEDMKVMFSNSYFLRKNRVEGDDWIPVLTRDILPNWKVITISADRDMYQCHKYPNYSQYDPVKKKMIVCPNPKEYLLVKIIMGDLGDNIPAIKPRTGKVNAVKVLNDLTEELKNPISNKNFERNKLLIDFDCIPTDVLDLMKTTWNEYKTSEFRSRDLMKFLTDVGAGVLIENIHELITHFKPLI